MTKFDRFFARMQRLGVMSQNHLADILNLSPQAISDAKQRGVLPDAWAPVIAKKYKLPIELILEMDPTESVELHLMRECMKDISKIKKRLTVLEKRK